MGEIVQKLPPEITDLLEKIGASQRLIAHLTLVHDVALKIIHGLGELWPCLEYDKQAVIIGAATHDVGKAIYTTELTEPGNLHEAVGSSLLIEHGFPDSYARFARTHGQWEQSSDVEDWLVALADKVWKGARHKELEGRIVQHISLACKEEVWTVYTKFDDLIASIAEGADERLHWYGTQQM